MEGVHLSLIPELGNKVRRAFIEGVHLERVHLERVDCIRQQLHLSPKDIFSGMEKYYPNLTQKQVHYWWTRQVQALYKKDNDQLLSAKMLLEEAHFDILLFNCEEGIKYIGFVTNFFNQLKSNGEIIFDATCKQNQIIYFNINCLTPTETMMLIL